MKTLFKMFGLEVIIPLIVAVISITSAVLIQSVPQEKKLYGVANIVFAASIPTLVSSIGFEVMELRKGVNRIEKNASEMDCVVFENDYLKARDYLCSPISGTNINSVKIVCYGTGYFGDVLRQLLGKENVNVDVILYNPNMITENDSNQMRIDRTLLEASINILKQKSNIHLHYCSILPTIRGAVYYNKTDKPALAYMQSYYINSKGSNSRDNIGGITDTSYLIGEKYSPAIIAPVEKHPLIHQLADSVEREYRRLSCYCTDELTEALPTNGMIADGHALRM